MVAFIFAEVLTNATPEVIILPAPVRALVFELDIELSVIVTVVPTPADMVDADVDCKLQLFIADIPVPAVVKSVFAA